MSGFTVSEVNEPILNSPFEKPTRYWYIKEGEPPILGNGRRPAIVFPPRDQKEPWKTDQRLLRPSKEYPSGYELVLVNLVRERVEAWKSQGYPGVSRTTLELIQWWTREGREKRLFFAQLEAALTIVFLTEARADFLQGIEIPRDDPSIRLSAPAYAVYDDRTSANPVRIGGLTRRLAAWMIDHDVASYGHIAKLFVDGEPYGDLTRDDILDNITLSWLTNTGVSAARLYTEFKDGFFHDLSISVPAAVSVFPEEIYQGPRSWAERAYSNLLYYKRHDKGGHFAAWEQPQLLAEDVRAGFRSLRSGVTRAA